ncbi:DUF159 family protein [Halobacteriales archaeon SW_6_65_46]|nr:MAG: DUF159 family protein [Halobacteriales archaeon SW_6_65_46]
MCGRYSIYLPADEVGSRFDVRVGEEYGPHYNAAPSQRLPVVTNHDPDRLSHYEWGFRPDWADSRIINARTETLQKKFGEQADRRRCLVLADGYYEWADLGDGKRPYRITRADGEPFAMAGVWEPYEPETTQTGLGAFGAGEGDGTNGEPDARFTILTTEANAFQSTYHHRMPVVLASDGERRWLAEPDESLLTPYDGEMDAYPVSKRVNSPANDDPDLVDPV